MKKYLFPILLTVAILGGCANKEHSAASDTTKTDTTKHGGPVTSTGVGGVPTAIITTPSVTGGQAGPMTISIPANSNSVLISVISFGNDHTQTVTVMNGTAILKVFPFSGQWASFVVAATSSPQTITVTDSIGTTRAPYPNVASAPVASGTNTQGLDITAYSDNSTPVNKTVITVTDLCGLF